MEQYNIASFRRQINTALLIFLFTVSFQNLSADSLTENELEFAFPSGETLHYQLRYRGLLTSMIWADLADVKMTFLANKKTPEQKNGHQFILQMSTQNYTKAEMFHPVRYTYTATLDSRLQRTLLVEKIDTGASKSHDFLWLDWENKQIQVFKKRKKQQLDSGIFGISPELVWEKDGKRKLPDFLMGFPPLDKNQSYLVHKGDGNKITENEILEPLSVIYNLRNLDIGTIKEVSLIISDTIRPYRIEKIGIEDIQLNGITHQSLKYKVKKNGRKDKHFYIWLSNDKKKIPLLFAMDAPLGKLEIELVKVTQADKLVSTFDSY